MVDAGAVLRFRGQHSSMGQRPIRLLCGPEPQRRQRPRRAHRHAVPRAGQARSRPQPRLGRPPSALRLHQRRPVRRADTDSALHPCGPQSAARGVPVQLGGDLAGDLRVAVPRGDDPGGAPRDRRPLHVRGEHNAVDPPAVPRRPRKGAGRSRHPAETGRVPQQARNAHFLRPGSGLRELPCGRLPRAAPAGNRDPQSDLRQEILPAGRGGRISCRRSL